MAKFLSDAWFAQVATANAQAGDLNLPPALATLIINARIDDGNGTALHIKDGKLHQGSADNAISTISIDGDTFNQLIKTGDKDLAIEAFMTGKIRVDGDMTAVMALQSAKPSPEQKALFKEILAFTEF
ncbi:SCP-2 sterol transfer family protein [Moraxella caviae]|uniref:SCP-2 sterol transfer family protein n=1 Tax=Moraxella caviae TaxID=34060 RepID=A0A1T0AE23_9GAMM|nr:SCP2 sterol-binding domain-containing protein [Moraxella caviae]OOR93869.1 SCP-2 sterol transfer family protein [Moraxella caviae]STZ14110.1 Putative sterol carrier protein [Moraxella caviae]